jgi:hypothetical protein
MKANNSQFHSIKITDKNKNLNNILQKQILLLANIFESIASLLS